MHQANTFSVLKNQLDRSGLQKFIDRHDSDKHCKGFNTKFHLLVMIYAQLAGLKSLRSIALSFNSLHRKHYHLGVSTVGHSTLAYANSKRSSMVFSALLASLLHHLGRKRKHEVKDLLYLLDSTSIMLKGHGFDKWTLATRNRCTQGLKLHVAYEANTSQAASFKVTPANVNDITVGREAKLIKQATYVFDKGYCDYDWWYSIDKAGSYFVTRAKRNTALRLVSQNDISEEAKEVIEEDAIVCLNNTHPRAGKKLKYLKPMRRITVARPDKNTSLILVTNDLKRSALKIAELYKQRWLIELFFKWVKQNLNIKCFIGRSENAVRIQILSALIAYTLIADMHHSLGFFESPRELLLVIKSRLFLPIDFEKPPPKNSRSKPSRQLNLGIKAW